MNLKCPECKSENISQFRMMTGKIWCSDCGFSAPEKEKHNPFVIEKCNPAKDLKEKLELIDLTLEDIYQFNPRFVMSGLNKTNSIQFTIDELIKLIGHFKDT